MLTEDLAIDNHRSLRRLVLSLQASLGKLNLLIAICDNRSYREQIVQQYETELKTKGISCYRVTLNAEQVSLRQALENLVNQESGLVTQESVLVTVFADELLGISLQQPKSVREQFLFSLQWTREALQEFQLPIILWVTEAITKDIADKAPDFWSWRGGVFEFQKTAPVSIWGTRSSFILSPENTPVSNLDSSADLSLQIKELNEQINVLKAQDHQSTTLASLYNRLANLYQQRLDSGQFKDYRQEQAQAIEAIRAAISLQEAQNLEVDFATSLNNLAVLYQSQGCYSEAEPLLVQALEMRKRLLGNEHPDVATSLNNLAELYRSQCRYSEAEALYGQALEMWKQLLGNEHPDVATSLNNLAVLYDSQGRYSEAEPLLVQALEMRKRLLGNEHPDVAASLNNLAFLYNSQGRYSEAEPLYVQAVSILYQQLGENHPNTQTSLGNLLACLNQAIQSGQENTLSNHPLTQHLLQQLKFDHVSTTGTEEKLSP
jgi:tetratricopeptide (TPR) repeat protein